MSDARRAAAARAGRARRRRRARVKVAIVGGTGPFGRALAARLVALGEDEVVIGSRDAERAQAAAGRARRRRGRDQRGRGARRRPRRARRRTRTPRSTPRAPIAGRARHDAAALGRERAAVLEGRRAPRPRRALARRARPGAGRRARSSRACTRSRPRTSRPSRPTRTRSSAATTRDAKELALELAAKLVAGRALDAGPLASARTLEGMTAVIVNLNRRYKAPRRHPHHRPPVISIVPVEGLPEIEEGDDLGALIAARRAARGRRRRRRRAEGRLEGRGARRADRGRRGVAAGASSWPAARDPREVEVVLQRDGADRPRAAAVPDRRDAPRLRLRVGRRRPLERARAGHGRAAPGRPGRERAPHPRHAARADRPRRSP